MCAERRGAARQPTPFRAHFHPPRPHLPRVIASPGALETHPAPGSDPDASALPPTDRRTDGRMERWTWRGLLCAGRTVRLRSLDLGRPRCRDVATGGETWAVPPFGGAGSAAPCSLVGEPVPASSSAQPRPGRFRLIRVPGRILGNASRR